MFIVLGFIVVVFMFYHAANEAKQSKFLWVIFAIVLFILLGMLFLFITERYILHIQTVIDSQYDDTAKTVLSAVSMLIIIGISYLIQDKFLPKKK
jgi:hypothetical protein